MSNMIEHIDYFPAGFCSSHSGLLFKGIQNEKLQFPAGVFLIYHREKAIFCTILAIIMKSRKKHGISGTV